MSNIFGPGLFGVLLFALMLLSAPAMAESPFCSDPGCKTTRQTFQQLCDYIVANRSFGPSFIEHGRKTTDIFVTGYYMRTLVAGYEILGDRRYLATAIAYGDTLLRKQFASGYWDTGYYSVNLADTGSALGLFTVLYKHVDRERQKQYRDAVERYLDAIPKDGLIHPDGGLGRGWGHDENGKFSDPRPAEFVISSALTGGEIYTWMYCLTKDDKYRRVAYNAMLSIFNTMRKDGVIPFVDAFRGLSLENQGDPKIASRLWDWLPYLTAAYVGEGLLSFDLHCDQPAWKAELRKKVKPNIEWLLATQNPNGSWSHPREDREEGSDFDLTRTPGIANTLIWYYTQVEKDPRILTAVRKFDQFLVNPEEGKAFGQLNRGAVFDPTGGGEDVATSLTGYALTDILVPGLSSNWDLEWHPGP
jgi:hypothetical protein